MKSIVKKLTVMCLMLLLCLAAAPQTWAADAQSYVWAYAAAVDSGDLQAICQSVENLNAIYPNPSGVSETKTMLWPAYNAAFSYDKLGNYAKALEYYQKFIRYAEYLEANNGENHQENIKGINAIINHLMLSPQLYVEAAHPADVPYFGAKNEPASGTYFGKCDEFEAGSESAYLLYVSFFHESVEGFGYMIPQSAQYLEIAWNLPEEGKYSLDMVNSGAYDDYIISNLRYIATLPQKVLLRFGAEVNCWALPEDSASLAAMVDAYKAAFRRVADYAHQYAPNAAMVYSPNDISNWNVTVETFYPGDEYVDWVGMSMYDNPSSSAHNQRADTYDAYYCVGYYDNPIVKIKNVVDSFGDRKPIMISECGFGLNGGAEAHAVSKLKEFYGYVNMVYPQVKAVFYFNANIDNTYALNSSSALRSAYQTATQSNAAMQASVNGNGHGYTRFQTLNEQTDTLNLAFYAAFPSPDEVSVGYTLDGFGVASAQEPPYRTSVDVHGLTVGQHKLTVAVSCGSFYQTYDYIFYVGANQYVCQNEADMQNAPQSAPQPAPQPIRVTLFGEELSFEQEPVIVDGRTLVPMRAIFEAMGAEVEWIPETQTIIATRATTEMVLQIGSSVLTIDDEEKILDVPAQLINGYTMVPARAIVESFGCKVDWDGENRTVIIHN